MLEIFPTNFDEFLHEAGQGNVVPIVRSVLADMQTPVSAYLRISHTAKNAFLLESVEGGERLARYSFIGANPYQIVRGKANKTIVETAEKSEVFDKKFMFYLREHFSEKILAQRANLPPLCGGAVGFFGYDATKWFEPVLDDGTESETDDACLMFFKNILVFDRLKQRIEIIAVVFTEEAEGDEKKLLELYEKAVADTVKLEKLVSAEFLPPPFPEVDKNAKKGDSNVFLSNLTKAKFTKHVKKIKEHILAGNAYQVVLSQRFRRQINADALQIYRALRTTNPSPYMFLLKMGAENLIGASPEMLIRCRGQRLDYRPIAGTRKRGETDEEDWILGEEMKSDEKELAEHTMLVDLGRNDLGKIAEYGSVEIDELMLVEKYSHVQHLVTSLRANLRKGLDKFDALSACFPAGTVTGAPKIRAMQIINQLEPTHRGVYAGAIGYLDYADNLDTCIAIRTIHLKDNWATLQAGAGIVADSKPDKEYEETINKARVLVNAIEMAEKGL